MRAYSSNKLHGIIDATVKIGAFLFSFLPPLSSQVYSQERVREFFEWGEYDSLLTAVNSYFAQPRDTTDPDAACRYRGYAGVAWFAKGDIDGARQQFRLALECRGDLKLDPQYVMPEMINLFSATKRELEQERIRARREDSLRIVREEERRLAEEKQRREEEKRRQAVAVRASALTSRCWKNATVAAGLFSLSAVMGGLAGNEYYSGKKEYPKFTTAAQAGDKTVYEEYRSKLTRKNRDIVRYSVIAGICGGVGAYCTFRAARAWRMKASLSLTGDRYEAAAAVDF